MAQHWHLIWMAGVLFLIAYLGSPRFRGTRAQDRVRRLLSQSLDKHSYHQFHDIWLPAGGSGDRLDHLLVSRFGVFLIISEYRPGEISGGELQENWKQKHLGRILRWPNPVHRLKLHSETLRRTMDLPESRIFPVVVFDGQAVLPEGIPHQAMVVEKLVPFIRSRTQQLLTHEQANRLAKAIANLQVEKPRRISKSTVVRALLGLVVVLGIYVNYGESIKRLVGNFEEEIERLGSPENFNEDGARKSEQQLFEESLNCAYSEDTNRCSCYQQGGEKVEIELQKCRELAERGSILKQ